MFLQELLQQHIQRHSKFKSNLKAVLEMPKMFAVEVDKTLRKHKCMSFIMNFIIFDNEYATVSSYDEKRMHL